MFLPQIKKISLLMTVFAMVMFISCKDEKSKKSSESDSTSTEVIQNNVEQTNAGGEIALNPPHGQPGHRCEIPVGAPLNGSSADSPIIQAQPQTNQSPVIKSTGEVPINGSNTNTGTTGRVNPPHGQPGHRCEIPVGAPLD
jgi:hypothetical protein